MTKINHLDQTEAFQRNWEGGKSAPYFFFPLNLSVTAHLCRAQSQYSLIQVGQGVAALGWRILLLQKAFVYSMEEREMNLLCEIMCLHYITVGHQKTS